MRDISYLSRWWLCDRTIALLRRQLARVRKEFAVSHHRQQDYTVFPGLWPTFLDCLDIRLGIHQDLAYA